MTGLPEQYASPQDLPFNVASLSRRLQLRAPDADPGGDGVWLVLQGTDLLLERGNPGGRLPSCCPEALYLGDWDGQPCRLVRLPRSAPRPDTLLAECLVSPVPKLPIDLLSLGGLARMVLHWERNSRYCASCGKPMARLPGEWGKECRPCKTHRFPQIAPCVIVLVRRPGQVLLTRKADWAANRYSLVAGFLDFGECLEEAVAREVREETGVRIANVRYVGSQCWPFPSQVMCGFVADYADGELQVDTKELEDARWFDLSDLPTLPPKRSIARFILDTELKL